MNQAALYHFTYVDGMGVLLLWVGWFVIGRLVEHPPKGRPSVSVIMRDFRRDWMRQLVTRSPRIFDANVIDNLRQATSFYVSATMIAIGGGLALLGKGEQLSNLARDFTAQPTPEVVWDVKILVTLLFVTDAFLRFVWAHRLFGYCAILMAAVPNDPEDPEAFPRADQAAEVNIHAAKNFNAALRSVYFALACLPWLIGPLPLLVAATATVYVLWRREFASLSRQAMLVRVRTQ
ncbi:DUF599 domain-containing protein [Falsirhodobacter xinxiangensis]|uniref:DUF599 domain-containing protein n=1 Tax=Falsirhodobacter xinxiangensis TaxID=2530049 RepID=UPI001FE93710|nr:DUF599 domain-containing protein [Rhodobacter xinxiangensis]